MERAETLCRLSSSLRALPPAETLARARAMASRTGISRVTEITHLDKVGVPVFASVRPGSRPGSLCVHAGKGLRPVEARVGAYMEAIEFAFAELGASTVKPVTATARDVIDGRTRPDAILDVCPIVGVEVDLDAPLTCVEADEIVSSKRCLIPAELVFHPADPALGAAYFGSSTNGLGSGNTVLEATVHALAEVIERDVRSFHAIKDTSSVVMLASLPPSLQPVIAAIHAAGLSVVVKYMDNVFELPCFMAAVAEASSGTPIYVSGGYACHPLKDIAVTRAICEALQSRLSFIHGARDDLEDHYARFVGMDETERAEYARDLVEQLSTSGPPRSFEEIRDGAGTIDGLDGALEILVRALRAAGMMRICRVTFTTPDDPLHVVRVVVPGLEFFTFAAPRLGVRLRDHVGRV